MVKDVQNKSSKEGAAAKAEELFDRREEKCSVCGGTIIYRRRHKWGMSSEQVQLHALAQPEDPAFAANPASEAELAASAAFDLARQELELAKTNLADLSLKLARARGGQQWSDDGSHTKFFERDTEIAENEGHLWLEAPGILELSDKKAAACLRKLNELHTARMHATQAWREQRDREERGKASEPSENRGPLGKLLARVLAG
jgi:hypothetical protein